MQGKNPIDLNILTRFSPNVDWRLSNSIQLKDALLFEAIADVRRFIARERVATGQFVVCCYVDVETGDKAFISAFKGECSEVSNVGTHDTLEASLGDLKERLRLFAYACKIDYLQQYNDSLNQLSSMVDRLSKMIDQLQSRST